MHGLYLTAIIFSIIGMLVIDWRYKLAFFYAAKRTALITWIGVMVFLVWDLIGIHLDIFFIGQSSLMTGILLAPELPIEELFFLWFLCYFSLIIYRVSEKLC